MAAKKKTTKRKSAAKKSKGKRYSPQERKTIVDFAHTVNAEKGRGGIAAASKKFGATALTISNWLKKDGTASKPVRRGGRRKASGGGVWEELVALKADIDRLEEKLAAKRGRFDKLKKKL